MFEVKIPISEKLVVKDLIVYYVTDDSKTETYEVTIEDGYAVLKTNHFSIYILSAKNEIENPKTFDNILLYTTTSIISLVELSIIGIYTYIKKNKLKLDNL